MKKLVVFLVIFLASCGHVGARTPAQQFSETSAAVFQLQTAGALCTAFHIGSGILISASHCHDPLSSIVGGVPHVVAQDGKKSVAQILANDSNLDLLVLSIEQAPQAKLELDQAPGMIGDPILTIGFPMYMKGAMMFETGSFKGLMEFGKIKRSFALIDASATGYSGGPIINLRTGKVIAVQHKLGNLRDELDPAKKIFHDHWLGIAVLSKDLIDLLESKQIVYK